MLTGYLAGGALVAADGGKPIVETERPGVPEGYDAVSSWRDDGSRIVQAWEAVPSEGSVDDAVRALARMQAAGLGDEDALNVAALFPEWAVGATYAVGDRVRGAGILYRCLQAHTALAEWTPGTGAVAVGARAARAGRQRAGSRLRRMGAARLHQPLLKGRPRDPRREDVGVHVRRQRVGTGHHRRAVDGDRRIGRTDHA